MINSPNFLHCGVRLEDPVCQMVLKILGLRSSMPLLVFLRTEPTARAYGTAPERPGFSPRCRISLPSTTSRDLTMEKMENILSD